MNPHLTKLPPATRDAFPRVTDLLNPPPAPPLHNPGFLLETDQGPLLKVYHLDCGRWHTHGGDGHQPGDITSRMSHCDYKGQSRPYIIQVWANLYYPDWADSQGRLNLVGRLSGFLGRG